MMQEAWVPLICRISMDATNVTKKVHETNGSSAIKMPWSWGSRPENSLTKNSICVFYHPNELPTFVWRELRAAKRSVTCSWLFWSRKQPSVPNSFGHEGFFGQLLWKFLVDLQVGDSHLQFLQGFLLQAILDKWLAGYGSMNELAAVDCIDMYLLEQEILLWKHLLIKEAVNHPWNDTSPGSSLHALDGVLFTSHERSESSVVAP